MQPTLECSDPSVSHTTSQFGWCRCRIWLTLISVGNDVSFSIMPYGQWWRDHRRAFWQAFHPGAMRGYRDTVRAFLHEFLRNTVTSPEGVEQHLYG